MNKQPLCLKDIHTSFAGLSRLTSFFLYLKMTGSEFNGELTAISCSSSCHVDSLQRRCVY